jgi:hypothetical protein
MKKEVIFAVLIGLGVGLLVTFGVYTARKTISPDSVIPSPFAEVTSSGNPNNTLRINTPEDESLQNTKDVRVAGVTDPAAVVVVFINERNEITRADDQGNFAVNTTLDSNSNVIRIVSTDEDGNIAEATREVIYTTVNLNDQSASDSLTATPSASGKKASPSPTPKASAAPKASPKTTSTASPLP